MKICDTNTIKIYCGLRVGYTNSAYGIDDVYKICQTFCDEIGLCVEVSPTTFIYKDGGEEGAVIGLINYPRFPCTDEELKDKAVKLALLLMKIFKQERMSLVGKTSTIMLEKEDLDET